MSFIDTIHPGCLVALARLTMDEVGIARAIAAGELVSPQRYGSFWMFAIRITGTGKAYRPQLSEVVFRPPEHYLTEEFLARCNGLPVILDHPEANKRNPSGMLNTKEYKKRVIGAIMLPYIKGDEVWGIARINDESAARLMMQEDLSTSPGAQFKPADGDSLSLNLASGGVIFFEGKPYVIDHIAICSDGVWDKGDGPSGVLVQNRSDSIMAEAETEAEKKAREEKEEQDRTDAVPRRFLETLDAFRKSVMDSIDAIGGRIDAVENKWKAGRTDADESPEDKTKREAAEKEVAESKDRDDKARRDADEAAKEAAAQEKERADALKASNDDLLRRLAALESRTPLDPDHADYPTMVGFQARADRSYSLHGLNAPRPMEGETPIAYRRRLVGQLKKHSADYKEIDIAKIDDEKILAIVEKRVYADAEMAARKPVDLGAGELRKVQRIDEVGRRITEYHGDPLNWMRHYRLPYRLVSSINKDLGASARRG